MGFGNDADDYSCNEDCTDTELAPSASLNASACGIYGTTIRPRADGRWIITDNKLLLIEQSGQPLVWNDEADLIVVGFGAAGASTALEAEAQGLDVLVIDRFNGGGATAMSGGVVYAGNTRYQRDGGIEDSIEDLDAYLQAELKGAGSPDAIRRYAEDSAGNLDWLASHGVPFEGTPYLEKTILPPDGYNLYFAGNEKNPANKAIAKPAPRGHKACGSGMTGDILFDALRRSVESRPVRILRHSPVRRLVADASSRIIGVEIETLPGERHGDHRRLYDKISPLAPFAGDKGERTVAECRALERDAGGTLRLIRARRGVVLATGGFEYDLARLRKVRPAVGSNYRSLMRLASLGNDGAGLALGEAAGGATRFLDQFYLGRVLAPPNALLRGVLVNREGRRFVNEDAYGGDLGGGIADQPGSEAWLILPAESFRKTLKEIATGGKIAFRFYGLPTLLNILLGGTKRAKYLATLARKCGIDYAGLEHTLADYDARAKAGEADPLGKASGDFQPLGEGPFYAIRMSMGNRFGFTQTLTLGGLITDEHSGRVVRPDGTPIEGLYAAGRVAAGLCSQGYISGMALGDCVFSGRRAARHAAGEA